MIEKKYYTVTEVCEILSISPSLLRMYEKKFGLKVGRNLHNRRIYRESTIQKLQIIVNLIRSEGYTIWGAVKKYKSNT